MLPFRNLLLSQRRYLTTPSNFEFDYHKNHVNTNFFQRTALSVGSAIVSLLDPRRADMISCLGETTGAQAAEYVMHKMQASHEGSDILRQQPRINSDTIDLEKLKNMPDGTLGKVYTNFLDHNKVTPDSRLMVQFVDDINLAYVIQRYREVHDLIHTVLQMPTNMLGEVTVKWVEAIQTRFPMCIGGALFGPVRLKTKHRQLYRDHYLPWALKTGTNADFLLNLYFEKRWEQPLQDLHREMGISPLVNDLTDLFKILQDFSWTFSQKISINYVLLLWLCHSVILNLNYCTVKSNSVAK